MLSVVDHGSWWCSILLYALSLIVIWIRTVAITHWCWCRCWRWDTRSLRSFISHVLLLYTLHSTLAAM
ncbi:hypothetical protein DENSPDRAFT_843533 [Dentipellis sp. KUC8613]|nr:hypothetical protein DENSPDRAFT_843533 [Dentipellis sp. KUC8613]